MKIAVLTADQAIVGYGRPKNDHKGTILCPIGDPLSVETPGRAIGDGLPEREFFDESLSKLWRAHAVYSHLRPAFC